MRKIPAKVAVNITVFSPHLVLHLHLLNWWMCCLSWLTNTQTYAATEKPASLLIQSTNKYTELLLREKEFHKKTRTQKVQEAQHVSAF